MMILDEYFDSAFNFSVGRRDLLERSAVLVIFWGHFSKKITKIIFRNRQNESREAPNDFKFIFDTLEIMLFKISKKSKIHHQTTENHL